MKVQQPISMELHILVDHHNGWLIDGLCLFTWENLQPTII